MGSVEVVDMINGRREPSAFQPEKKVGKEIDAFVRQAFDRAQLVIKDRMPKKILHLSQLLQEKDEYRAFFEANGGEGGAAKKSKRESGGEDAGRNVSEAFQLVEREFEALKLELLELVDMTAAVKLWLQLNVPRIEDGNNFGVSIQSDTVAELARVEDAALAAVEAWSKFLMMRAKVVSKLNKHREHVEVVSAYKMTMEALDEKQVRSVWIGWLDLRNNYAVLWDLIVKNMEKLLNPRSYNTSNMY